MDVSKMENVQYELTWQDETFLEMEVKSREIKNLYEAAIEIANFAMSQKGKVFLSMEKQPKAHCCIEIIFHDEENKKLFLERLQLST